MTNFLASCVHEIVILFFLAVKLSIFYISFSLLLFIVSSLRLCMVPRTTELPIIELKSSMIITLLYFYSVYCGLSKKSFFLLSVCLHLVHIHLYSMCVVSLTSSIVNYYVVEYKLYYLETHFEIFIK